jgi:hypothetical protein
MNRQDLRELQAVHDYPCLTITLPTHRTFPDNKQDQIRVKNLVSEATNRLLGEFSKRDLAPLLERLDALVGDIDYTYTLDGLLLAVNREMAREYVLPFTLAERVVVDDTFFTRDLVHAMVRTRRYWVLSLSERATRLYSATREHLEEITAGGFPMEHLGPGGDAPLPGGQGINPSRYRDDHLRAFFRVVDRAYSRFATEDPLPLVLAGVDRHQSFFQQVSTHSGGVMATLAGNYDHLSAHDLGQRIWPEVRNAFAAQRQRVLEEMTAATGQRRLASTLGDVWHLVRLGRGDLVVVEEGYHQPARIDERGELDFQIVDPTAPDVLDDAVDEVITHALDKGGRVAFVNDGDLSIHNRIALVLRY